MGNHSEEKGNKKIGRIVIGVILAIIGIAICFNGTTDILNSDDKNTVQTSSTTQSKVTKENYDKIKKGMTKAEVKKILGEPSSVSENETPGVGTMELNHYQETFELKGIDIYYLDGKVYMKNWTEL